MLPINLSQPTIPPSVEIRISSLLKPVKSRKSIADEYGIDVRTLRRWCHRHNLSLPAGSLSPKYQRIIYESFGPPPPI